MAEETLVLGGGFGGIAAALELREAVGPEHPITVVDRRDRFYVGFRKIWVMVGSARMEEGERPLSRLTERGIRFLQTDIQAIDPGAREVETTAGRLKGGHLVVALGAEPRPDLVPGLAQHEHAFSFYDPDSVRRAAERVTTIREGRVVVLIAGLPYKCPPAPYEAVLMLDDHFRSRGVRDRIQLTFTTLQPGLLPNAGPEGARWIGERLDERGIRWEVGLQPARFEEGSVHFEERDGSVPDPLPFDLAIVAPPHRPPAVIERSALAGGGGWISVDPGTLETSFEGVYAIGDVTRIPLAGGAALPKAGLMAEAEGVRVARAIAARLGGEPEPARFDGRGRCFLETGGGEAALLEGEFFREPAPSVRIVDASPEHLEAKRRFESERLEGWLGDADQPAASG